MGRWLWYRYFSSGNYDNNWDVFAKPIFPCKLSDFQNVYILFAIITRFTISSIGMSIGMLNNKNMFVMFSHMTFLVMLAPKNLVLLLTSIPYLHS